MRLYVTRHGQTRYNAEDRYLGALDPDLTDFGIEQAQALIAHLPYEVTALVSSPLRRARQTATMLSSALSAPVLIANEFRERDVGVFEGLTQQEAKTQFPDLWARNITRLWNEAPEGGETIQEVFERVTIGLENLFLEYEGNAVVLVTHGFVAKVIKSLLMPCTEQEFFEWSLANGCVAQFEVTSIPLTQRSFFRDR